MIPGTQVELIVRPAMPRDVEAIAEIVNHYAKLGILLGKDLVTLYEDVQEFFVTEIDEQIVGCGALHVMWEDLAEIRSLAVVPSHRGLEIGSHLLNALVERATELEIRRLFCLTFEIPFFRRHGFEVLPVIDECAKVVDQLLLSKDDGIAEYLDLERVKENTLGNTRMFRYLF